MANADLSVTKIASPNPVGIGQPLTYTITARNNGPDTATSVAMKDTIPSGVCISDITVTQGSYCYENGIINWNVGTLTAGGEGTMTVTVIPKSAGIIGNTANVYHNNQTDQDPNLNNNSVTVNVTVTPSVDLIILKESCPMDITPGSPIDYSITVLNNGPSTANNVIVTDTLPAGVTVQSVVVSQGSYQQTGNIISCNLGSLDMNDRANIRITVIPNVEGLIENTAEVTSDEPDSNPENNHDSAVNNVGMAADISITKTASSDVVVTGQTLTYTLLVKNSGPSLATNVKVVDNLPPSVSIISITQSQGSYSQLGNDITFNLGNLASNATATIEIKVKPTLLGMITNLASASAEEIDPNKCNNTASVCTFVSGAEGTDISVVKTHSPEPAGICSPVLYTITVKNNGPTSATGIILTDNMPSSLEIISVNCSQGKCCICNDKGRYQPSSCCHNEKQKDSCQSDYNQDEECKCDEGSCKVDGSEEYNYKEDNCGEESCQKGNSQEVYCDDNSCQKDNPKESYYEEYSCDEDSCHKDNCSGSSEIICQLGSLAVGESAVVQVLARPKVLGSIKNTAIVTANEDDFNPANNEATDTLTVITTCEQIENLINKVNELITSGDIGKKQGKMLIALLNSAKASVCCNNSHEAKCALNEFINKVKMYIQKKFISEEQGCTLIKAAELIKQGIRCFCTC